MINIKDLTLDVQRKIAAVNSSTSVNDLENLYKLAKVLDGSMSAVYDSDGQLPDATSAGTRLAYIRNTGRVKLNNGKWDTVAPPAPTVVPLSWSFQGSTAGLALGGSIGSGVSTRVTFADDTVSTNLYSPFTYIPLYSAASSSAVHGYAAGNSGNGINTIYKVQFTNVATITSVGTLSYGVQEASGSSSETHGYTVGGAGSPGATHDGIQKHSFTSDGNATNVGYLGSYLKAFSSTGCSSATNGYTVGGTNESSVTQSLIKKYSHASDGGGTTSGNLTSARFHVSGVSSYDYGYAEGGATNPPFVVYNTIESFPFAADASATSVGSLTVARRSTAAVSSQEYGYNMGGGSASGSLTTVDKHSFASSGNATSVGTLQQGNQSQAATQY